MSIENVDVLIIGAGPSGSVAGSYLHKMGISTKIVEKTKFPRIVVGESLIPRVMDHFDEADLLPALNSYNFEKKFGARFIRGNEVCLFDFGKKFSEGWDWTWQIPRADFDKAITDEMQRKGIDIEFETEVTDVKFDGTDSLTTVKCANGTFKQIHAKFLIDASGYGRVLPRMLKLDFASRLSPHSAIFSHVVDSNRPEGEEGVQITFDILDTKVWLWVIPFSNGKASVGIVGPTDYINSLDTDNAKALSKGIELSDFYRKRLSGLRFEFEPKKLSNYSSSTKKMFGEGYVLTGNSTEFLDPVFSSGVCFATESGMLAAKLAVKLLNGEKVDWQTEYADHMNEGIDVFTTYIQEWYTGNLQELFFHQPENPEIKKKICSVLAGYVWDKTNPFVLKHNSVIKNMAHLIKLEKQNQ